MPVLVVRSPKGGVGKTTLTASLAIGLCALGWNVIAVDFDVQNSLRLHLQTDPRDTRGWATGLFQPQGWRGATLMNPQGVAVLPFGAVENTSAANLDNIAAAAEASLMPDLAAIGRDRDTLVIMDTSPGPSRLTAAACGIAELEVAILLADPASYAAGAALTAKAREERRTGRFSAMVYVINQLDVSRSLSRDVHAALSSQLGPRLIGSVHQDAAIAEALANQQSILLYDRNSRAARDILGIAVWLDRFFDELENHTVAETETAAHA